MLNPTPGGWARFDDLSSGSALVFTEPERVLIADRVDQVVDVLGEVERAAAEGRWAFGYLAYEAAAALAPELTVHDTTPFGMPLAWFGIGGPPSPTPVVVPNPDPRASHDEVGTGPTTWAPEWTATDHRSRVADIKQRIARGDTYQVNLTERLRGRVSGDPLELYRDLALGQRGAYNAYLDLGPWVVASASPELFVERTGDAVVLRPMKGTARRGRYPQEDHDLRTRLRTSTKERAENVMIVDLVRNDISRVAVTGSVCTPTLFDVERYETVWQLTSTVTAQVRPETSLVDLFTVLFPCGSVTGAPKISAMEIIRELEPGPRGVYCGAIGYVGPPDAAVRARFSVAIRTVAVERATGQAIYGTGGGITWDSEPAAERSEALTKAAVLSARPVEFTLVETMRHEPGSGLRNRDRHLRRLLESAAQLGFVADPATIRTCLDDRLDGAPASRVRLTLARTGEVAVELGPVPSALGRPVVLAIDLVAVDSDDWRLFHKISWREPYDSRRRRHPEADDVILVNEAGELTETTRASLAVRLDGRWWTPPLPSGCLPGVERARLLDTGVLGEHVLRPADLRTAERVAVVSSLRGWLDAELHPGTISIP